MEKIYFRPNAPISSLFSDLPNETIIIDEDTISETITDYQGNILVDKNTPETWPSVDILKTLIAAFDEVPNFIDNSPVESGWDALCIWLDSVLGERGWIPVKAGTMGDEEVKSVNGQELFFEMEID